MNNNVQKKITVDFLQNTRQTVNIVQNDAYSRVFSIYMYAGGAPYTPDNDAHYAIYYIKQDGTNGGYDVMPDGVTPAVTVSENVLTAQLAPQMTTVAGHVLMTVEISKDDGEKLHRLQAFGIDLLVEESASDEMPSNDYWKLQSLSGIQDEIERLDTIAVPMRGATQQADGEAGLVPAPAIADRNKVLHGNGQWQLPWASNIYTQFHIEGEQYNDVQAALEALADAIGSGSGGAVSSVNGQTGAVTIDAADITANFTLTSQATNVQQALDQINIMRGATAQAAGTSGLVPAPAVEDRNKVLYGNGQWKSLDASDITAQIQIGSGDTVQDAIDALEDALPEEMEPATERGAGKSGLVPRPPRASGNKFLRGDATWALPEEMQGATAQSAGLAGLVPAPGINDREKFLCGNGQWVSVSGSGGAVSSVNGKTGAVTLDASDIPATFQITSPAANVQQALNQIHIMQGATEQASGSAGLVPAPSILQRAAFLRGNATWAVPNAYDINFSSSDFSADNVDDALNELYDKIDDTITAVNAVLAQVVGGGSNGND